MHSRNWTEIDSTKKAVLWDTIVDGRTMFVVTIGMGKKIPDRDSPAFLRDNKGFAILKGSSWRYPYTDNREKMLYHARALFEKHC